MLRIHLRLPFSDLHEELHLLETECLQAQALLLVQPLAQPLVQQ
jgi:hypothetical protein